MYYYLLPQKGWTLLIFSDQSEAFGLRDSADCKQRETKRSAEGAEREISQPVPQGTLLPYLIGYTQ